jgi:hypothetical protein
MEMLFKMVNPNFKLNEPQKHLMLKMNLIHSETGKIPVIHYGRRRKYD